VGCPPTFHRGQVYFWQENGDIVQLNWQRGTSRHLAQGIERVVAAPLVDDKHLYFGSHDHTLHCLQIHEGQEAWQQDCKRSISVTPCLGEGLIVVGTNDGYVYAFEAQSAAPVWKINVSNQSPVLGSPLFHEGVFYLCAEDQQAHALPWHMGQYAWAAHWLAERQDKERSAEYYVLAAMLENHSQEERQQFNHSAIDHWQAAGEWEKAARFCESLIESEPQTIARQYEQAGVTQGSIAPRRAAQLMRQAARWYREAGDSQAADRVNRKAARLAKAPFLTIQGVNIPPQWVAGVAQVVVIEVNNTGNLTAQRLRLRFAGNLVGRQWVEIEYPLPAGDCLEVEATLVAVCSGELVIDIHYQDLGGESWHASQRHPIQVQAAPPSLVVEQDIGMLDVDGHYGNIIVRGSAGLIKVAAVGQNNGMQDGSA